LPIDSLGGDTVLNKKVFEIGAWRNSSQQPQIDLARDLPDVPVMPETLLLMELSAHGRSIDLHEITQIVLGDLGATIQTLRLAGHEYPVAEGRPNRIEDCISALGVQACIEAASRRTLNRAMDKLSIRKAWSHAGEIAGNCKRIAETMARNVGPDEAYLNGLLHSLGSLPAILGWEPMYPVLKDPDLVGLRLAQAWSLPLCVVEYFRELRDLPSSGRWSGIVHGAHEELNLYSRECSSNERRSSRVSARGRLASVSS
jgi:hypothetical protein